jgi:hypothetical protein
MLTLPPVETRIAAFKAHMDWLNPMHHWHEGRHCFADGSWHSGRYNDHHRMAIDAVMSQERHGSTSLYYGMNPLKNNTNVGGDDPNKLLRHSARGTGASRNQIRFQGSYALEIDSHHPKDVMATDAEQAGSVKLAEELPSLIRTHVPEWPEPARVSSGNGTHLVWPVDDGHQLESDAWKFAVNAMAQVTSGSTLAKLDTSIVDAPRILRAPGGINRKGEDTPERPWRYVTATYPAVRVPINHGLIYRLAVKLGYDAKSVEERKAALAKRREQRKAEGMTDVTPDQVHALIAEYPEHLDYAGTREETGRTLILLKTCPFVGRKHAGSLSSFILRESEPVGYKCLADGCPCNDAAHAERSKFRLLLSELRRWTGRWSKTFPLGVQLPSDKELLYIDKWGVEFASDEYAEEVITGREPTPETVETETAPDVVTPEPIPTYTETYYDRDEYEWSRPTYIQLWADQHPRSVPPAVKEWVSAQSANNWEGTNVSTDPAWWGLTFDDVSLTWWRLTDRYIGTLEDPEDADRARQRAAVIWKTRDIQAMGNAIGIAWLMSISLNKQTRPELPDEFEDEDWDQRVSMDPTFPPHVIEDRPACLSPELAEMETYL